MTRLRFEEFAEGFGFVGRARHVTGWYRREKAGQVYYTNWPSEKTSYIIAGEGKTRPTPEELKKALEANPKAHLHESGDILVEYDSSDTQETPVELPAGSYRFISGDGDLPERLLVMELRDDKLVKAGDVIDELRQDVISFLGNEKMYRDIGTIYKRGILLYGPPGEGKTSILRYLIQHEMPKDTIVIFLGELPSTEMLLKFKKEETTRLKIFVIEELTELAGENVRRMERMLNFLDGELSVDKCIVFATTNYPEQLPGNIVDRPSRFDKLIKIGHPKEELRAAILELYMGHKPDAADVECTKGLSISAIKEAVLASRLHGVTLKKATSVLKKRKDLVKKEFADEDENKMGFGRVDIPDGD